MDSFANLHENGNVYSAIFSELLCVVSKYPKKIHRNTSNNLHNNKGSAIEWGNLTELTKWDCYYINGRNVPADKWQLAKEDKITKEIWLQEKNEDIKAAWFEILGSEKVVEILGAEKIDSQMTVHANGELEEHILYKTPFILEELGEPLAWIKFVCPSTQSNYLISCNPKHNTAKDAVLDSCPFYGEEISSFDDYKFNARG